MVLKKIDIQNTIYKIIVSTAIACASLFCSATERVVTNNANSGEGSLRNQITLAEDGDAITFSKPFTIALESTLELGDKSLYIDGNVYGKQVHLSGNYQDADNDSIDDDGIFCRPLTIVGADDNIKVQISNLIIENGNVEMILDAEESHMQGGGVYIDMTNGGQAYFDSCTIQNNALTALVNDQPAVATKLFLDGAGIYSMHGGVFTHCTVKNNRGIARIDYNAGEYNGSGGVIIYDEDRISVYVMGGGVYCRGNFVMSGCLIAGNKLSAQGVYASIVSSFGGGIYSEFQTEGIAEIYNSVVVGNEIMAKTLVRGGGIALAEGDVVANCTVLNNTTYYKNNNKIEFGDFDAGISTYDSNIINTIVFNNNDGQNSITSAWGTALDSYITQAIATEVVSDAEKNDLRWVELTESPFVKDPSAGEDGVWGTADDYYGDLRLKDGAPCIDAGIINKAFDYSKFDFNNNERISGETIDIGAFEYKHKEIGNGYFLKGSVNAESSAEGIVYLINAKNKNIKIDSCTIGKDGSFEFTDLESAEYYLYAVPATSSVQCEPTYFGNETELEKALTITLDADYADVDIALVPLKGVSVEKHDIAVSVFPNPAQHYIFINSSSNTITVEIIDQKGNRLYKAEGEAPISLPVSSLHRGIYFVKVFSSKTEACVTFEKE